MKIHINRTFITDIEPVYSLYKSVAISSGGIIRIEDEITRDYISAFIGKSIENGLSLIAIENSKIIGEIHAYTPNVYAFRHMLSDLTIVIHPEYQGKGIGKKLFSEFLEIVKKEYRHILRIELYVREANKPIVTFYQALGFINEGRQKNKILNAKSELETPLHMAWFNPKYMNSSEIEETSIS